MDCFNKWLKIIINRYQLVLILSFELLFCLLLYKPLFFPLVNIGIIDQDFFLAWQLLINDALRSGNILHWAHHFCGGIPALANPQSGALSPYNLPGLIFDPVIQMKLNLIIHFLVCGLGFYLVCRTLQISPYYGLIGFIVWVGNGFILFRILHGQLTFYPLLYFPLLFNIVIPYLYNKFKDIRYKDVLTGTLIITLIILEDGFQILIYQYIFLFSTAIYYFVRSRNILIIKLMIYWILFSIGICAVRILPMAELLWEFPRMVTHEDFMTFRMVYDAFFNFGQLDLYRNFQPVAPHNVWPAYGSFIGWIPFFIMLYVVIRRRTVEIESLLFGALICFLFMLGNFSFYAPWSILHTLPLFDMVRSSHRFSSMVIFMLSIVSVIGLSTLYSGFNTRWLSNVNLIILITIFTAASFYYSLNPLLGHYAGNYQNSYDIVNKNNEFKHIQANPNFSYTYAANNLGLHNCYRALVLPNNTLAEKPLVMTDQPGSIKNAVVGPNSITINVDTREETDILININYHRNWVVEEGKTIGKLEPVQGIMKLTIPVMKQKLTLKYIPYSFNIGFYISLIFTLLFSGCTLYVFFRNKLNIH